MHNKGLLKQLVAVLLSLIGLCWSSASARPSRRSPQSFGQKETLTGMVTDSKCKGRLDRKAVTLSSCARQCVHYEGAYYVLLVGNAVYALDGYGNRDVTSITEARRAAQIMNALDKFAGGSAVITGDVNGDHILVESVSAVKKH